MKKPLYYLDDYEKRRILEMHQTATKKQYIKENKQILNEFWWWVIGGAAVIGGAYALYSNWHSGTGKDQFLQMNNGCKDLDLSKVKKLNTDAEHKSISQNLNKAFEIVDINPLKYFSGKGPEGTTDEEAVKTNLGKIKSVADYCAVAQYYKQSYGQDLGERIDSEISVDFPKYVMEPLSKAVEYSANEEEKAKKQNAEKEKISTGGEDEEKNDEDFSDGSTSDDKSSDSINYKVCVGTYKIGCMDTTYTHTVAEIQSCLGIKDTGKFDSRTRDALRSRIGRDEINNDEIPIICGNF